MSIKNKVIVFLAFCFISAIILACSEDFITSTSAKESVKVNKDLAGVSELTIKTRLRDSVFTYWIGLISDMNEGFSDDDKINASVYNRPSVFNDTFYYPNYVESTAAYLEEFFISWDEVENVAGYEIRVYPKPIDSANWLLAEKLYIKNQSGNNGVISAVAQITPTPKVYTSKCVNCGECKKACPTNAISYINSKAVVDFDKCIECGECFRACDYNSIGGVFAGSEYYFAIRTFDDDSAYSEKILCTDAAYKMRYVTLGVISDSLLKDDPEDLQSGNAMKGKDGCGGNCTDGSSGDSRGDCSQCYILTYNTCPVNAVYQVDSASAKEMVLNKDAMLIDTKKCINCGECAKTCYTYGPWGAVVTEIVKVD